MSTFTPCIMYHENSIVGSGSWCTIIKNCSFLSKLKWELMGYFLTSWGICTEPVEVAPMRLTPGERQSGDGTSLPETPNNLTNVSTLLDYTGLQTLKCLSKCTVFYINKLVPVLYLAVSCVCWAGECLCREEIQIPQESTSSSSRNSG